MDVKNDREAAIEELRKLADEALRISDALGLQMVGCHLQWAIDLLNEA